VTAPHDRPTAAELLEAVREFLDRDVLPATEGRVQFHTRVALNALEIVGREITEGPASEAEHAERLSSLGFDDDVALCAAIRDGSLDGEWDDVFTAVFESVIEKVRIANPGYLEEDEAKG
jgi:hypothetical protein